MYSETSNRGLSEIGTVCNRPLCKGHCSRFQIFILPNIFTTSEKRTTLYTKDKTSVTEFTLSPTCPLFRGCLHCSIVHYIEKHEKAWKWGYHKMQGFFFFFMPGINFSTNFRFRLPGLITQFLVPNYMYLHAQCSLDVQKLLCGWFISSTRWQVSRILSVDLSVASLVSFTATGLEP